MHFRNQSMLNTNRNQSTHESGYSLKLGPAVLNVAEGRAFKSVLPVLSLDVLCLFSGLFMLPSSNKRDMHATVGSRNTIKVALDQNTFLRGRAGPLLLHCGCILLLNS